MAASTEDNKIYALVNYEDPYVQPLIINALKKHFPPSTLELISNLDDVPSKSSSRLLQWVQYESIDFGHLLEHSTSSMANAYVIRKALIRKHYLSTTVANWVVKHPDSVLARHVKPSVEFEVDYAEFLDDALVEAWELHESWARGATQEGEAKKEWWILKPGMSERGQGIRLFSSEEELQGIFEGWDPESDDEEEEEEGDADARSDDGEKVPAEKHDKEEEEEEGKGIITSQLRHFIAQPYIHPPLLLDPSVSPSSSPSTLRKFHIRTYVLATGALSIHVYRPMLALFAAKPYTAPSSTTFDSDPEDALRAHLTNTCLQSTGDREGSVSLFWSLPDEIPPQPFSPPPSSSSSSTPSWKSKIFTQICDITASIFEAAARSMSIHFQALPNAFEIFGLDFMVGVDAGSGELTTWLLEVNAFPDFRQTGEDCKGVVEGLMEEVVRVGVVPFFKEEGGKAEAEGEKREDGESLVKVLDIDLGRR